MCGHCIFTKPPKTPTPHLGTRKVAELCPLPAWWKRGRRTSKSSVTAPSLVVCARSTVVLAVVPCSGVHSSPLTYNSSISLCINYSETPTHSGTREHTYSSIIVLVLFFFFSFLLTSVVAGRSGRPDITSVAGGVFVQGTSGVG